MIAASMPVQRPRDSKLLVIDETGQLTHHARAEFPSLIRHGDLIVANDAATVPASLPGIHRPSGEPIEVRLAGRDSLLPDRVTRFVALIFGAGDYRTPTEHRLAPPVLRPGDALGLGPLQAVIVRVIAHARLVEICFDHTAAEIWEGLARHGRPIQYAHMPPPLAIWDTWTPVAHLPVAFEAPSASFFLDWTMVGRLRQRGASFATLTHAAGISSTGNADLDRLLPFDEPYAIPEATADAIAAARRCNHRIIAVGTTVVRALEHAAAKTGVVRPGNGVATNRIGPHTELRVVDAIVSGVHDANTSHYELLRAFHTDDAMRRMVREADACAYRTHEFGDSVFIAADRSRCHSRPSVHTPGLAVHPRNCQARR